MNPCRRRRRQRLLLVTGSWGGGGAAQRGSKQGCSGSHASSWRSALTALSSRNIKQAGPASTVWKQRGWKKLASWEVRRSHDHMSHQLISHMTHAASSCLAGLQPRALHCYSKSNKKINRIENKSNRGNKKLQFQEYKQNIKSRPNLRKT